MLPMKMIGRATCFAGGMASLTFAPAIAADADGNYAVLGAGGFGCTRYQAAAAGENDDIGIFLRWFDGYLSGMNRLSADTYDHSPILDARVMGRLVLNMCRAEPELPFEVAVARTLTMLSPARDQVESEMTVVSHEGQSVSIRRGTMRRLQELLAQKGYYASDFDGLYGPGTRTALQNYQEGEGLDVTGIPDASTVLRLMLAE